MAPRDALASARVRRSVCNGQQVRRADAAARVYEPRRPDLADVACGFTPAVRGGSGGFPLVLPPPAAGPPLGCAAKSGMWRFFIEVSSREVVEGDSSGT